MLALTTICSAPRPEVVPESVERVRSTNSSAITHGQQNIFEQIVKPQLVGQNNGKGSSREMKGRVFEIRSVNRPYLKYYFKSPAPDHDMPCMSAVD